MSRVHASLKIRSPRHAQLFTVPGIIYIHRNINFLAISTAVFQILIFIANHDVNATRLFPKHLLLTMSCREKVTSKYEMLRRDALTETKKELNLNVS